MLKSAVIAGLAVFAATVVLAAGDAERGKSKTVVCVTCHGSDGKATLSMYPHLAGQNAEYLVIAMKAYKSGQRKGNTAALMFAPMATLSEQDIQDLAAYYTSLTAK